MLKQIFRTSWSKYDSNYWDLKPKVVKKDDNGDFCLVQTLTIGEPVFNQLMLLRNQLVIAAENFGREENLSPVLKPTKSKDMDDQLKLAQKVAVVKMWDTIAK